MAARILTGEDGYQVIYCSTTMKALPLVHSDNEYDLSDFIEWLPNDPREYSDVELDILYWKWYEKVSEPSLELNHIQEDYGQER